MRHSNAHTLDLADVLVKDVLQLQRTLLGVSLLTVGVVDVCHTKPRLISLRPLKVARRNKSARVHTNRG